MILMNIIKTINLVMMCRLNLEVRDWQQGGQLGGNYSSPGKRLQAPAPGLHEEGFGCERLSGNSRWDL